MLIIKDLYLILVDLMVDKEINEEQIYHKILCQLLSRAF